MRKMLAGALLALAACGPTTNGAIRDMAMVPVPGATPTQHVELRKQGIDAVRDVGVAKATTPGPFACMTRGYCPGGGGYYYFNGMWWPETSGGRNYIYGPRRR